MTGSDTTAALIVAGGRGSRAGDGLPKQFRPLPGGTGESVLAATLQVFAAHAAIDQLCVVIHKDDQKLYDNAINTLNLNNIIVSFGGGTRQQSVQCGLRALQNCAPKNVLIHDAARPFVSNDLIARCIDALQSADGAIPALPVTDTLKRGDGNQIVATVDRDGLYRAQTPQAFIYDAICKAHEAAPDGMTDDAAVAEQAGLTVALVDGDPNNIKLTHEEDFMTSAPTGQPRTGSGFDVHRFGEVGSAETVMLGGISIPHDCAIIGHSDADVALHAITDALLGALAEGDIGDHFPPSDAANKDRPSADFLTHAVKLAAARQARISHIDLTLICERPKIGPHRDAMRARIGALTGLPVDAVSVKATTTEGLGFTGRGEGIAAQAIVSLTLPATA